MKFPTRFEHRTLPGLKCGAGRVKQSFREECDINFIMRQYSKGIMPQTRFGGVYGDVSQLTSYEDGLALVGRINDAFSALPSAVRSRFRNDPRELLVFLADKANLDEARELGLVDPLPAPVPTPTPVPAKEKGSKDEQ